MLRITAGIPDLVNNFEIVLFLCVDQQGAGIVTAGVFTYFFWVLLQPFRGNPEYKDVADLPYNSSCLTRISSEYTDMKTLGKNHFALFGKLAKLPV